MENTYYNELYLPYDEHPVRVSWEDEIYSTTDKNNMSNRKEKDYKIYVIGHSKGYGSWIQGHLVKEMADADVVVLTGGEDISPALYNERTSKRTHLYLQGSSSKISNRDEFEVQEYTKAVSLNKTIWGTCRGAQLLCAMAGGKLIQDMDHPYTHKIHFYDNEYFCTSNSLHHQMQYPYDMKKEDYNILAYSINLSGHYIGGNEEMMTMPDRTENDYVKEPEFIYYPKIRGLGIQGHPEMMGSQSQLAITCQAFLNLEIEGHLQKVLALNIPVKDILDRAWDFSFTEEENKLYKEISKAIPATKVVKRNKPEIEVYI